MELGENVLGIEPDQVLVLETDCQVEDFQRAIQRIPGLEWLGEEIGDDLNDEDEDDALAEQMEPLQTELFGQRAAEATPYAESVGHFYVTFSNQRALSQLEALWTQYEQDQNARFDEGLAPLREVFRHLVNIRPWGVEDRLRETGLLVDWKDRLQAGAALVPVEIELWFRLSERERTRRAALVRQMVTDAGGTVLGEQAIDMIRYHAILARLPAVAAQRIVAHDYTQVVRCEEVMFLHAVGQVVAPVSPEGEEDQAVPWMGVTRQRTPARGQPRIALLDGLPLGNHVHLAGRLIIDDPDGWEDDYQARDRRHGTAMASLILHGEMDAAQAPLSNPLYVRPILRPNAQQFDREEQIPEEALTVDLMYRALRRMFEGDGSQAAAAPHVVVVNVSVCDRDRPFLGRMLSPWARLLDWAAWEYKVLFCVSAGNQAGGIVVRMEASLFRNLPPTDRERLVLQALKDDHRNRRLLAPAEAINAMSVGAAHHDHSTPRANERRLDVFETPSLVSPISAQGPGFRRAVKPDLLLSGGRVLFEEVYAADPTLLKLSGLAIPPGHAVAAPGRQPGELTRTSHLRGTSNATALASRAAAQCLELLDELVADWGRDPIDRSHLPALLKAMLAHSTSWDSRVKAIVDSILTTDDKCNARDLMTRFFGYGVANVDRLRECTENRATLIGWGDLAHQEVYEYRMPIPPSLANQRVWRRLIVTLGWLSPLNFNHRRYRGAKLWFKPKGDPLVIDRRDVDHNAVRRGTLQHEVRDGVKLANFVDGDDIVIHVYCRKDAGGWTGRIPYGLCVTLEVEDSTAIPIYDEIRARIGVPVRVNAGN